jgi:hypothetical protein
MKFDKIRLKGLYDIDLQIQGLSPSASYILKAADGLGPPDVTVYNMKEIYLGREPVDREIVLRVGLNPDYAAGERVSDLREKLYGLLTPGINDEVTVQFLLNNNAIIAVIKGQIRQMPINPFSDEPEMQIVIACYGSFLLAPAQIAAPLPANSGVPTINNIGSGPAGFKFNVTINSQRGFWWLKRGAGTAQEQLMQVNYVFLADDVLKISTEPGNRFILLVRNGVTSNIIDGLSTDSTWLMLHGGLNSFTTLGPSIQDFTLIAYTPRFWGI